MLDMKESNAFDSIHVVFPKGETILYILLRIHISEYGGDVFTVHKQEPLMTEK
jgi:hypothetical protein